MVFNRWMKGTSSRPADPNAAAAAVTLVALDDELGRLQVGLERALGPTYRVVESAAAAGAAAAIGPARLARLEALRAAHPDAFILVYDLVGNEPGTYLEALADD